MGNRLGRKFFSVLALFSLLINLLLPTFSAQIVFAEEATQSATLTPETVSTPSATPVPTPVWKDNGDGSFQTADNVVENQVYSAPQNNKVTVKFNKLPSPSGKIIVKEVKLSADQVKQTKAISDTAYDISSTMDNGTFEYTLTLPTVKTDGVEVKASEDGSSFVTLGGVSAQADTLTITGLNHFTVFVIAGTITEPGPGTFVGELFDESSSRVVINEFVYNPSTGNEWIEVLNKTGSEIDLENWELVDGNGNPDDLTLTGFPVGF